MNKILCEVSIVTKDVIGQDRFINKILCEVSILTKDVIGQDNLIA